MSWVVTDIGPWPKDEERVWGPFKTKKEAREWSKGHLCDCCKHKVIKLYDREWDGDWE